MKVEPPQSRPEDPALRRGWFWLAGALHQPSHSAFAFVNGAIWVLIVVSIAIIGVELAVEGSSLEAPIALLDQVILWLFVLELVLRVLTFRPAELDLYQAGWLGAARVQVVGRLRYLIRPMTLVDLITVLAVYPPLRALRAARLLRLVRTVRIFKYANPFGGLIQGFKDNAPLYSAAFGTLGVFVVIGGVSLYLAERGQNENIQTIGDGLWWGMVTITTVGFGDIAPITPVGRLVGAVLMVVGMFMLAMFAGIVGNTLLGSVLSLREEVVRMSGLVNHVVIIGYDSGARMLMNALSEELDLSVTDVVVFADMERPRQLPSEFQWVRGDPTKESELAKIRISKAAGAIVVGSRQKAPQEADATTILTLFTIRAYMQKQADVRRRRRPLTVVAEILDAENVEHARTAGATEVIETHRLGFALLAHSLAVPGSATILSNVAAAGHHNVYIGQLPRGMDLPASFELVRSHVKRDLDAMVIGLRDPTTGQSELNPPAEFLVQPEMKVVYLAEQPVLGDG